MSLNKIYLDHNATTPLNNSLLEKIPHWLSDWGNPSSIHWAGRSPKTVLRESREILAQSLSVSPLELIFTSGGTESNNLAIRGVFDAAILNGKKPTDLHFVTTQVEHPSVMKCFQFLEQLGAQVDYIPVSRDGVLDTEMLRAKLRPGVTTMVSVMYANNETGNIFPVGKIAKWAHSAGALMHSDCVQAFGKIELNFSSLGIDLASFSAHKFYALKGSGFLFVRRHTMLASQILGGGQERRRRGGTENVLGIRALGYMAQFLKHVPDKKEEMLTLRSYLESRVFQEISGVSLTGAAGSRLPNTSSFVIEGVDGETMLMRSDLDGFAVSTGAACSSGNPEPSPVLLAMGLKREEAQSSLRVSLGWQTTRAEIDLFVTSLKKTVSFLREIRQQNENQTLVSSIVSSIGEEIK